MKRRAGHQQEIADEAARLNRRFEKAEKHWREAKESAEARFEALATDAYGARRMGGLVSILGTWVAVDQVDTVTDHSRFGSAPERTYPGMAGWHPWFEFGGSLPEVSSTVRLRSGEELTFPLTADVIADVLATPPAAVDAANGDDR